MLIFYACAVYHCYDGICSRERDDCSWVDIQLWCNRIHKRKCLCTGWFTCMHVCLLDLRLISTLLSPFWLVLTSGHTRSGNPFQLSLDPFRCSHSRNDHSNSFGSFFLFFLFLSCDNPCFLPKHKNIKAFYSLSWLKFTWNCCWYHHDQWLTMNFISNIL